MQTGQRVAAASMVVSGALAVVKIFAGLRGHSTAVVADGLESASDVFASGFVLLGLTLAAKPADRGPSLRPRPHRDPYGLADRPRPFRRRRVDLLWSVERLGHPAAAVAPYVVWPLVLSLAAKTALAVFKFRYARRLKSASLTADAWNDMMDTLSAIAALIAVGLALADPARFADADSYGGFVVGLIVIGVGVKVACDTAMQLMDTMPEDAAMAEIRAAAASVPECAAWRNASRERRA